MKTNKVFKLIAGLTMAVALTVGVNAAFEKTSTYTDGQFKDVKLSAWYAGEVASAYELAFMNGTDDDMFSPESNVTVAQGITMAARVNSVYNNKAIPNVSVGNWYDGYVKYAVENGIIKDGQFESFTRNITRAEMAVLFANALPASEYGAINKVEHIPDVVEGNDYAKKILMLYNAGIVMGSDDYGTFNPDADIKRSESAAIINRVALKENRVKGTLKEYTARDAYTFVYYDGVMVNKLQADANTIRENIESGWRLDNRGGPPRISIEENYSVVTDISETQPATLMREFNKIDKDKVVAEFVVTHAVKNGGFVKFADIDVKDAFVYAIIDGKWNILGKDGKYTAVADAVEGTAYNFRVYMDIPAGKVRTYIDGKDCGESELLSDNIASIRYHINEKGTGSITPGKMNFVANYGVFENFDIFALEDIYGWKKDGAVEINADDELVFKGKSTVTKPFEAIDTKYIAEMLAFFPDGENAGFKVLSGDTVAVDFVSKDGKLYANGTVVYEKVTKNMWYRLRVEANPSIGKALIVINGRELATVALGATEPVDSLVMYSNDGNARMDNIKVYADVDHYDYVPAPYAKATFDDYIVAMNVCNLWYNDGSHNGWAVITPYDENRPVLGYYDEGNRETADWEVKYMVEGGIDIQAVCWYASVENGPIKTTKLSSQLNEGLQLSKYQDYMKYCLIWEAGSGTKFNGEQFRNHVIPYWFENFFLDENYAVIENKLLLHLYGLDIIGGEDYFGSTAQAKEEFKYLEETAKSYGFDGFIFVSNGQPKTLEEFGINGYAAYHWGADGYQYSINTGKNIELQEKAKTFYTIPTISVGYSDFAWRGAKMPLMTTEDWDKCHEWVKTTYIPKYAEKGTWEEKMVWISTWNEYGEGTYIMPCEGLRGFDYLDVLRDKYTDMPKELPHIIPDENQLERINHMYPQYRRFLRYQGDYKDPFDTSKTEVEYEVVKTIPLSEENVYKISNIEGAAYENGILSGKSTGDDFNFLINGVEGTDLDDVAGIRFELQVPVGKSVQVFFSTESEQGFSETKSATYKITKEGLNKVTVDFAARNSLWTGKMKYLRIDPCNGSDVEFKVGNIEFIKRVEHEMDPKYLRDNKLFINEREVKSKIYPEMHGDRVVYPFDPETAIDLLLYTFIDWNHDDKILTLQGNNHKVLFKIGSDKFTVDGKEKSLGYTLYDVDGLPMLDMQILAEAFGYTYKAEENNVYITTPELELFTTSGLLKPGAWEFNGYGTEGWKSINTNLSTGSNYLHLDNTESKIADPSMTASSDKLGFNAKQYGSLEIKVRYKYDRASKDNMTFYFTTEYDTKMNENKTLRIPLNSTDSNGEWEVYTYDLTQKEAWIGKIKALRFDPFSALGTMDIDYIRFIENPDYEESEGTLLEERTGIINGDAETPNLITFTSNTAKITIEEDAANPGNHVYRFTGRESKAWTYAIHKYPFETGKKYKISFDVRGVGDSKGEKVKLGLSVNIQYPSAEGVNHISGGKTLDADGTWEHVEIEYIPGPMTAKDQSFFSCYVNPPSEETSGTFELDNLVVEEIA